MKGAFGNEGALLFFNYVARDLIAIKFCSNHCMSTDLPAEKDRPGVPIAPPLLFVFPILASLLLEWLVPTNFVAGPFRWIFGAPALFAGISLNVVAFIAQKRAGTDPIPFNPSTRIVSHG